MTLGLTFEKLLLIALIAAFLLGPERLPYYASQLGRFVKWLRSAGETAKDRLREEMGPDFDDIDWKKLDPRQYDPRRIVRDALTEGTSPTTNSENSSPSTTVVKPPTLPADSKTS